MAEATTTTHVQHPPQTVVQGTPVITRTETVVPIQQPANPVMLLENWTPFLVFILAVSGVLALVTKHITGKFGDFEKAHKPIHDNMERDIQSLNHKLANERQKIDQLERSRNGDVERIVKLETQLHSIEKGQERIEHGLEKLSVDLGNRIDAWAEQFSISLREVRSVKPRSE